MAHSTDTRVRARLFAIYCGAFIATLAQMRHDDNVFRCVRALARAAFSQARLRARVFIDIPERSPAAANEL